jgi:parvulin-like peptidyl-prolyl isomerase
MKTLLPIILSLVLISACQKTKPVARVGNQMISLMEFRSIYQNKAGSYQSADFEDKQRILDQVINTKLLALYAEQQELTNDTAFQTSWKKIVKGQVYRTVIDEYVIDQHITESMLKERYRLLSKEFKVRHIFLPQSTENKSRLQTIKMDISDLEDFIENARIHSRDSLTAGQGGLIGYIRFGKSKYGREFEKKIWDLRPGRVSNVVQSPRGYHLIWIENDRPLNQQPFDLARNQLKQELFSELGPQINQSYSAFIKKLKNKFKVEYHDDNIERLAHQVESRKKSLNESPQATIGSIFSDLDSDTRSRPVISYADAMYTIGDFFDDLADLSAFQLPPFEKVQMVKSHIERVLPSLLILQLGYDKNYDEKYEVLQAIQPQKEELLTQFARNEILKQVKEPSEQDLKDHYNENQHDFLEPAKAKIQEIAVVSLDKANRVVSEAKTKDFTQLVEKYSENNTTKSKKGMVGFISEDQMGTVGQEALKMEIGQISDPIENGNHYSIIKVLGKKEAQPRPFSQVRDMIYRALRSARQQQAVDKTLSQLKSDHIVQIYENILKGSS